MNPEDYLDVQGKWNYAEMHPRLHALIEIGPELMFVAGAMIINLGLICILTYLKLTLKNGRK